MGQRADQLDQTPGLNDPLAAGDAEIQQTREEMSETLEAIQEKLSPAQMTDDAKVAAIETVDHVVEEAKAAIQELTESASAATMEAVDNALVKVRELLPELNQQAQDVARGASEVASVAAMEAVEHALLKVKEAMPDLTQQAQDAAREAVDHAINEAKAALRELGTQTRFAVRDATIGRRKNGTDNKRHHKAHRRDGHGHNQAESGARGLDRAWCDLAGHEWPLQWLPATWRTDRPIFDRFERGWHRRPCPVGRRSGQGHCWRHGKPGSGRS